MTVIPEKLYPKIVAVLAVLAFLVSVGAMIWSFSDTNTKAKQAYEFSTAQHSLPEMVKRQKADIVDLNKEISRLETLLVDVAVMKETLIQIKAQLARIEKRIDRLSNDTDKKSAMVAAE